MVIATRLGLLIVILFSVLSCTGMKTRSVTFDTESAKRVPREVAADAVISFTKASRQDISSCIFMEKSVKHKSDGDVFSYENTCFRAQNVAYTPVDNHAHLFILNASNGAVICDSMIAREYYGQKQFNQKFEWLGTALLSLGSEYCPE